MAAISITIDDRDLKDIKEMLGKFSKTENKRVLKRAGSTAVKTTKAAAVKEVGVTLKTRTKKAIRESIKYRITATGGEVEIRAVPIPGHRFRNKLTGSKPPRGSRPVGTQWWFDSILRERDGYFRIHKKLGVNSPIFQRSTKKRLPIEMLFGPSAFDALTKGSKGKRRVDKVITVGVDKYQSELERQIDLIFRGL